MENHWFLPKTVIGKIFEVEITEKNLIDQLQYIFKIYLNKNAGLEFGKFQKYIQLYTQNMKLPGEIGKYDSEYLNSSFFKQLDHVINSFIDSISNNFYSYFDSQLDFSQYPHLESLLKCVSDERLDEILYFITNNSLNSNVNLDTNFFDPLINDIKIYSKENIEINNVDRLTDDLSVGTEMVDDIPTESNSNHEDDVEIIDLCTSLNEDFDCESE